VPAVCVPLVAGRSDRSSQLDAGHKTLKAA
jgi:hypothetical protein